jgi:iron complex transport system ATP-binding protein
VVLVLHDLSLAARVADQLLLLADGALLAAGPPRAVLTPALLKAAFGVTLSVRDDPEAGLLVLPPA